MWLILASTGTVALCLLTVVWMVRARAQRKMEQHSISPEELHSMHISGQVALRFRCSSAARFVGVSGNDSWRDVDRNWPFYCIYFR